MVFDINEIAFPVHWTPKLIYICQEEIKTYNQYEKYKEVHISFEQDSLTFRECKKTPCMRDSGSDYEGRRKC